MKPILAIALLALLACSEAKEQAPVAEATFTGLARGHPGFSGEVGGTPGLVVKQRSCTP